MGDAKVIPDRFNVSLQPPNARVGSQAYHAVSTFSDTYIERCSSQANTLWSARAAAVLAKYLGALAGTDDNVCILPGLCLDRIRRTWLGSTSSHLKCPKTSIWQAREKGSEAKAPQVARLRREATPLSDWVSTRAGLTNHAFRYYSIHDSRRKTLSGRIFPF